MHDDQFLDDAIRKVPDFPKPGILFYDINGILTRPAAFSHCIGRMEDLYRDERIDAVAAIEARGFLFAAPFAEKRGLPLILIRKKGKLPGVTASRSYALEYGQDTIQVIRQDVKPGMRILLVDDLVATGGTIRAAADLLAECGASVIGLFCVIGLPFLEYGKLLSDFPIRTLIEYHAE